jgi:PBP1b-binding outer membrane lipoprotein LpoB
MKKILSIFLLILLVNCSTTTTKNEEQKPTIDNIIEVFKSIPLPKF